MNQIPKGDEGKPGLVDISKSGDVKTYQSPTRSELKTEFPDFPVDEICINCGRKINSLMKYCGRRDCDDVAARRMP